MNLDDLELELRRVAGVRSVGFSEQEGTLLVQVQVIDHRTEEQAGGAATEITRLVGRLVDQPVTVEVIRWRTGPRPSPAGRSSPSAGRVGDTIDLRGSDLRESDPRSSAPGEQREAPQRVASRAVQLEAELEAELEADRGVELEADGEPAVEPTLERANHAVVDGEADAATRAPDASEDGSDDATTRVAGPAPYDGTGARVRLLATMSLPDSGEIEVHLGLGERRTIGRAPAGRGLVGAVEATIGALRPLVGDLEFEPSWATTIEGRDDPTLVAVGLRSLSGEAVRYGMARSASGLEAAAKATLHALNRTVSLRTLPAA